MATLQAKKLKDAIAKVRRVGRIEEPVTISGCDLVLQNFSQDEFSAALDSISELEQAQYAFAYQMEQIARSIIEIDGLDLREVTLIEDEVPVGSYVIQVVCPNKAAADSVAEALRGLKLKPTVEASTTQELKTAKFEKPAWLIKNVLQGWGQEALNVTWRKVNDVQSMAEAKAKEGVQFMLPEETPEERCRRAMNDLREAANELPDELVDHILDGGGLLRKALQEELDAADTTLKQIPKQEEQEEPASPAPRAARRPVVEEELEEPEPMRPRLNVEDYAPSEAVQHAVANRQRLNQQGDTPLPAPGREAISAGPRPAVPSHIRQAAMANTKSLQGQKTRAQAIAELEGQLADPNAYAPPEDDDAPPLVELAPKGDHVDAKAMKSILNRPPTVGLNPRFRPPPR